MIERIRLILSPALYFVAALLLVGIGRFAAAGLSSRYWADDYCYSYTIAAGGWLHGPVTWFMYSGNRFSTIYLVGLQDLFGPWAIRLVPGLVLLALVLGWLVLANGIRRLLKSHTSRYVLLPFALAQVFFLALLAPDRLQTIYWRMATLHYTFPMALLLLNLGLCLGELRPQNAPSWRKWLRRVGLGLLAFFAGGFSETFAALQAGMFVLCLLAGVLLLEKAERSRALWAFLPPLLGGIAAMGLMLLSPNNAWRQAELPPPESLGQFVAATLRFSFDFVVDKFRGFPLPLLALALLSGACTAPLWISQPRLPAPRFFLAGMLFFFLGGAGLVVCAISPSVFAGLNFPSGRAQMPAAFALLFGLSGMAVCLAGLLASFVQRDDPLPVSSTPARRSAIPLAELALFIALLGGSFYIARHLFQPLPEQPEMRVWAQRWDERDHQIRQLQAAGERDLTVREVEVVRGLEDMGPDLAHWVNRCAAAYYDVTTIRALP